MMRKYANMRLALAGIAVLAAVTAAGCGKSTAAAAGTVDGRSDPAAASGTVDGRSDPAAASGTVDGRSDSAASYSPDALKGSITMVGSTSMEKFATALSEVFMEKYPLVTLQAEFIGSGAGIEAVSSGSADIGNSSRGLKDEEKAAGVVENIVAIDGIAIVTDPAGSVDSLTKDQLIQVYTGAVANWKDLGGSDQPIVVIGREAGSGTRSAFEEILQVEGSCRYSNELDSTGAVMAKAASTPGAIGYVSLDVLNDTVKTLKLDGVEATPEHIKDGTYLLSRPFVMATKGEISVQSDLVKALFDFIASPEGIELIRSVGLIPVD